MADVQIAVIDQQNTQIALAAPSETEVTVAVPGVQGPVGEGVPNGGATNEVLFKQSGTDYDTAWGEITSAMIGDLEIVNADVATNAEIAVSKLADGSARQLLQTDAAGTGVEWTSNVDVPGTLDVTGATTLDSTLTVPLGSAAAPTLRFSGDANSGLYSPGADQVAISTNGTGRLFVDASGRVGIGTSAQQYTVHAEAANPRIVALSTSTTSYSSVESRTSGGSSVGLLMRGATATGTTFGQSNANGAQLYSVSADYFAVGTFQYNPLIFGTNNSERLRITSDGKLGLGTKNPSSLLHLENDGPLGIRLKRTGASPSSCSINNAGNVLVLSNDVSGIQFDTGSTPTERARIDGSGRLLVGTSTSTTQGNVTGDIQIGKAGGCGFSMSRWTDNTFAPIVNLGKSRGTSVGSNAVVQSGDELGRIEFSGDDGTDLVSIGANISAEVDGTPGANDMPGRLVFSVTADGAASPTEALRISSNRAITVSDGGHIVLGTGTGTKIGTSTSQKIGFFDETPIVQPTTGIAEAAFVENSGGTAVNVDSTFGGYTIQQVVQALQNLGLLA